MDEYLALVHVKDYREIIGYGNKVIKIIIIGNNPIDKLTNYLYNLKIYDFKLLKIRELTDDISLNEIDQIID